jgi:hypothetical protein
MPLKFVLSARYAASIIFFALLKGSQGVVGQCTASTGPLPVDGSTTLSSTMGTVPETSNSIQLSTCGVSGILDLGTPGVWFLATGNGGRVLASTCSDVTNFEHGITVFGGEDCDSRVCLKSVQDPDTDCGASNFSVSVEWDTKLDETYYILVNGIGTNSTGDFGLSLTSQAPENDRCETATYLDDMSRIRQTSVGASFEQGIDKCVASGGSTNPGVWYRVLESDMETMVFLSICSETFPFNVSVYYGNSCASLTCHEPIQSANFDEPCQGTSTELSWIVGAGTQYFLHVQAALLGDTSTNPLTTAPFELQLLRTEEFNPDGSSNASDGDKGESSTSNNAGPATVPGIFVVHACLITSLAFWL